ILPNFIGVDWLGRFPRSDFSQTALNEIGSFITLFRVREHSAQFEAKIDPTVNRSPTEVERETEQESVPDDLAAQSASQLAVENTQDFVVRRIVAGLSGYEFEHLTAHLMECLGYTAR